MKFTLYNYSGDAHAYYKVEKEILPTSKEILTGGAASHLIVVVDRSGSMWGAMDDVKTYLESALTDKDTQTKRMLYT